MTFEYRKLRSRIIEKFGSQKNFAHKLGLSEIAFSNKMRGVTRFSTDDILKITDVLDIPKEDISEYFFCPKS